MGWKWSIMATVGNLMSEQTTVKSAPDVRQLLAGHSDDRSHAVYTHTQIETLRAAIRKLPGIKS